jgi:acetyltransferase-like isoleucine patch superfamily enzyme
MRYAAKFTIFLVTVALVIPLAAPIALTRRWDQKDLVFQFGSQLMSLFPGLPGDYLRRAFYSIVLRRRLINSSIGFGSVFAQRDTELSDGTYIGANCNIGLSVIGTDTLLGSNVIVACPKTHFFDDLNRLIRHQGGQLDPVPIGSNVWIGNGAIILAPVGDGCVVAAGSVVVTECEPNGVYAGNPAKLIRFRGA